MSTAKKLMAKEGGEWERLYEREMDAAQAFDLAEQALGKTTLEGRRSKPQGEL